MSQNLLVTRKVLKKTKSVTDSILNYLRMGMTCKRKDKWIGRVKASAIEYKKINRNQKIKVKLFC